jgi:hypothetical protein
MLEPHPDGHVFDLSTAGILIPKGHLIVVGRNDSAVGDGDTLNVAGEIIEDCTGALDGRFTVDDPVFLPYGFGQMNIFELPANTVEEDAAKQPRKSPEFMRQRKDHMIIRYRQEFPLPPLEPCLDVALVAFRATTVTTGVVGILQPAAVITFKNMAPMAGVRHRSMSLNARR